MTVISSTDNIIDSRDVAKRLEELEADRDMYLSDIEEAKNLEEENTYINALEWFDTEYIDEIYELRELMNDIMELRGWEYGLTLVHEDYFTKFVIQELKDVGDLPRDLPWYIEIDEEATVNNLKDEYIPIEFDNTTYYVREG